VSGERPVQPRLRAVARQAGAFERLVKWARRSSAVAALVVVATCVASGLALYAVGEARCADGVAALARGRRNAPT
jgi:hypothetical protein